MKKTRLVLFDLGNVLVRIDPEAFWKNLDVKEGPRRAKLRKALQPITVKYEEGLLASAEYFARVRTVLDGKANDARILKAFLSIICEPTDGMEEIVRRVSSVVETALVSNTNETHFNAALNSVPALHRVPKHYLSFQMHSIKPQKAFYEKVMDDNRIPPEEMLFIDDVEENVRGAEAAGMNGILFRGTANLEKNLRGMKLI